MRKALSFAAILATSAFLVACDKGPAEMSLKAAESAVEGIKGQAEKFVPDQFASLQAEVQRGRELFNKGDYKAASELAKTLPAKAQEVLTAATSKKDELTKAFTDMQGSMPAQVEALVKKVADLKGKAPKGMDKAAFDAATASVGGLSQRWTEIGSAFSGGDIMAAVEKAKALKAEVDGLATSFGLTAAAAEPAAAPAK